MMRQTEIEEIKPIYIGYIILELIKLLIYEIFYDVLDTHFGQKIMKLLFMDIDSFILSVNAKDDKNNLKSREDLFDFSTINKEH